MNPKISIRNREGTFDDFWEIDESTKQRERFEACWTLSAEIGTGSFWKIELRPGFDLYITDYELQERIVINVDCPSAFGFGFLVSGLIKSRIRSIKDDFVMRSGQNELSYFPYQSGSGEETKKRHMLSVSVLIEPRLFCTLAEGEFDWMPPDLRSTADGTEEKNYYRIGTITPSMQAALHQIFNCPYHGLTRRLYLESRAMELIAYKLEQLRAGESRDNKKTVLRPNDIERIHLARELLIRDLENPPKLFELARSVGLTHNKLTLGFRKIYATTPFNYLRDMRLCRAKLFLDEGLMNVTEAAVAVGYSSLSHFAKAFKQYFGVAPGIYLREVDRSRVYSFSP